MGIVRMGPPDELIEKLTKQFEIPNFVETGTYYGNTAISASKIFNKVITIEFSQDLYQKVKQKYESISNIEFLWGDSRIELEKVVQQLNHSSLFWLDAHWSGGLTYGEVDQCPLIEEIKIINQSPLEHFIFIDDARLFLSPPQPPHKIEQWSNISDIIHALKSSQTERYIVIIEDVIIAVPIKAKSLVAEYCQTVNDKLWQEFGRSSFSKGINLIKLDINNQFNRLKEFVKKTIKNN